MELNIILALCIPVSLWTMGYYINKISLTPKNIENPPFVSNNKEELEDKIKILSSDILNEYLGEG